MNFKAILKAGDPLCVMDGGREYTTTVDDVTDESNFSIFQPCCQGKMADLEPGREYRVICVKSGGIHRFNAMAMDTMRSGDAQVINCRYTSGYIRLQRRNAFRCPMPLPVDLRKKTSGGIGEREWESRRTLDISENGMRLRLPTSYVRGDLIEAILHIDRHGVILDLPLLTGIIVRSVPLPNRRDEVMCGIQFSDIDARSRDTLIKLIVLERHSRMKQ